MTDLLGNDELGQLVSNIPATTTYTCHDTSGMRQFANLCAEDNVILLHATPATIVRYTSWLGRLGTFLAASL
jgi:hypothetical protein